MRIIQQQPAIHIPNLLTVRDIVPEGFMVTVTGVKTPWAFIRLWNGEPPGWAAEAKYIRATGTKGAPYKRHILDLFKSQRNAWMIGGQGALEAIATDGAGEAMNAEKFSTMNPTYEYP